MSALRTTFARWRQAWGTDTWARAFLGRYRKALVLSVVLGVLTMVFAVGLMFTSGYLISDAAEQPALGLFSLLVPLGLVQVFGIGKPFLGYFERLTSHDWVLHITSAMRLRLYEAIESQGMLWLAAHRAGDALGLLADDIDHVQNLYLRVVFPLVIAWILWIGAVIVFGAFSPLFGLVMLLAMGVLTVLVPLVSVLVNAGRRERVKATTSGFYAQATDDIAGIADWRFAQRKDDFLARIAKTGVELDGCNAEIATSQRRLSVTVQLVFGVLSMAVLVWAAGQFAAVSQAAAGAGFPGRPADWVAAFVIGFFPLLEAFAPLSDAAVEASAHIDSLERLNSLEEPVAVEEAPSAPAPASNDLVLDHVSFAYEAGEGKGAIDDVIRDIALIFPAGTKLAILGPSGSGKSTLLSLIRGDRTPISGSVTLGGVPTSEFGDSISDYIGLIQQNTYLFNETLFENLTMGDPAITREQAIQALEAVGLKPLLDKLPQGLDTRSDEAGLRFSGGERQRIALARVLLRDTPIVLLDEPMVGLDPQTERTLLDTLFRVFADRTLVMVTHHLLGIELMDRVVFLDDGRIVLDGTPDELARTSERFQTLLAFDRGL